MSEVVDELGERVAMVLVRIRGSVETLSRATGVPCETLQQLVRHARPPLSLEHTAALLRALRCSPDWLLGLSPYGAPPYAELRHALAPAPKPRAVSYARRARARRVGCRLRSVCVVELSARIEAQEARRHVRSSAAGAPGHGHHATKVPDVSRELGARLAGLLAEARIARAEFARVTGRAVGAVDELCRGRRKHVDAREVALFAKALGCTASWLLGMDPMAPAITGIWASFARRGGRRRVVAGDASRCARGPADLVPLHDPATTPER